MKASGLSEGDLTITRDGIESLIKHYCREAGVRNLQKHVEKIFRKAAVRKVRGELPPGGLVVDATNLAEFVGKPIFTTDRLYDQTPVGVVMGLAWTNMGMTTRRRRRWRCWRRRLRPCVALTKCSRSLDARLWNACARPGGSTLYIEAALKDEGSSGDSVKAGLTTTGQMGDVMKESSTIAYTFARGTARGDARAPA